MKTIVTGLFLLAASYQYAQTSMVKTGNFGGNGTNAPKLELREDHSFSYTDLTNSKKPVVFTGTWSFTKGKLVMSTPGSTEGTAMTTFTVVRDGKCLKSRKKLAFYTLCNCND